MRLDKYIKVPDFEMFRLCTYQHVLDSVGFSVLFFRSLDGSHDLDHSLEILAQLVLEVQNHELVVVFLNRETKLFIVV